MGTPVPETRDAFLRALAVAEPGSEARREALLWLADLDLSHGDGPRAELWLERLGPAALTELTAFIAFSNLSTRSNVALGIESQGFATACEVPFDARQEIAA